MKDSTSSPVRVAEAGIRLITDTAKMELDKPYRIHFAGEDLLVVWTGKQLGIYEVLPDG